MNDENNVFRPCNQVGEKIACYDVTRAVTEEEILDFARDIAAKRIARLDVLHSPTETKCLLALYYAPCEHEVFSVIFLDGRHRVIAIKDLFRGTIDGTSVHPREVVKEVLTVNAAAVIFSHNHPSGVPEPSRADEALTRRLRDALSLIDVRVLDHLVVGQENIVSMSERGIV